ncbi:MAG: hypothetical protein CMJ29_08170 [Phycisphaerae bacterium]|nr:hypothetical protein [Phycisphaerae bacterium]
MGGRLAEHTHHVQPGTPRGSGTRSGSPAHDDHDAGETDGSDLQNGFTARPDHSFWNLTDAPPIRPGMESS